MCTQDSSSSLISISGLSLAPLFALWPHLSVPREAEIPARDSHATTTWHSSRRMAPLDHSRRIAVTRCDFRPPPRGRSRRLPSRRKKPTRSPRRRERVNSDAMFSETGTFPIAHFKREQDEDVLTNLVLRLVDTTKQPRWTPTVRISLSELTLTLTLTPTLTLTRCASRSRSAASMRTVSGGAAPRSRRTPCSSPRCKIDRFPSEIPQRDPPARFPRHPPGGGPPLTLTLAPCTLRWPKNAPPDPDPEPSLDP